MRTPQRSLTERCTARTIADSQHHHAANAVPWPATAKLFSLLTFRHAVVPEARTWGSADKRPLNFNRCPAPLSARLKDVNRERGAREREGTLSYIANQ